MFQRLPHAAIRQIIYISFDADDEVVQLNKLQLAVNSVSKWYNNNTLKLNPSKSEFIIIPDRSASDTSYSDRTIDIDGHLLHVSDKFKFLGVVIDRDLSMRSHILQLCLTSSWQLNEIRHVRQRLDAPTTETIVRSFVTSRLDYCNSIFCRLPAVVTDTFTRILNTAARVITGTRKYDHITPVLHDLHWLPIKQRIIYKVASIVFQCLRWQAPLYLTRDIQLCDSERLRSNQQLVIPLRACDSFKCFAPSIWNDLPTNIRYEQFQCAVTFKNI